MSRPNVPGRHESVVGLDDDELADIVVGGELADGRKAGAGAKLSGVHQTLNPGHDLLGERFGLRGVDADHHRESPRFDESMPPGSQFRDDAVFATQTFTCHPDGRLSGGGGRVNRLFDVDWDDCVHRAISDRHDPRKFLGNPVAGLMQRDSETEE